MVQGVNSNDANESMYIDNLSGLWIRGLVCKVSNTYDDYCGLTSTYLYIYTYIYIYIYIYTNDHSNDHSEWSFKWSLKMVIQMTIQNDHSK